MKKIALIALFAALCLVATQFQQSTSQAAALTEPAEGPQLASLVTDAPQMSTEMIGIVIPLPDCGSRCYKPGAQQGCVDRSRARGVRTPCMCTSGYWICGFF